jgi:hypothetical protein
MTNRASVLMCVLLSIILTTACDSTAEDAAPPSTSQGPEQRYPNWPALLNDFRFHWAAEPGVDLGTGPAVAVRAYRESYDVATFALDATKVYPGFTRATPENQERKGDYLAQLIRIRPLVGYTEGPEDARTHYGFVTYHVLQLAPLGDGFEAIVCEGQYSNFVDSATRPGKFVSVSVDENTGKPYPNSTGVVVHRIELTQNDPRVAPGTPAPPAEPQSGPLPAPDQDVFGNWFVTASSASRWGPVNDPRSWDFPSPELSAQCADRMPQAAPERMEMMSGFKDEPPPHGEAVPGWPMKVN